MVTTPKDKSQLDISFDKIENNAPEEDFYSISMIDSFKPAKELKIGPEENPFKEDLEYDRSLLDNWPLSDDDLDKMIKEHQLQTVRLGSKRQELKADFAGWKSEMEKQIETNSIELSQRQNHLVDLEEKNRKLELELKSKLKEYETQTKKLNEEKEALNSREQILENKTKDYDLQVKEFDSKLKEIEAESKKLESQRSRLINAQKDFTLQVTEFENVVKDDKSSKLSKDLENSKAELVSEWSTLHEEQKRLEQIRAEIVQTKDSFIEKFDLQRQKLSEEREKLADEWGRVRAVRKNLRLAMPKLETRLNEILGLNKKSTLKVGTWKNRKDVKQLLADLEERLFTEISREITKKYEGSKDELDREWSRLQAEEEKLARIHQEILETKDGFMKKFKAQRDEIYRERENLAKEWNRIQSIRTKFDIEAKSQKHKQDSKDSNKSKTPVIKQQKPLETKKKDIPDDMGKEIDKELQNLQNELKAEWSELRQQHEKLTKAREEFSKAKLTLGSDQDIRAKLKKMNRLS